MSWSTFGQSYMIYTLAGNGTAGLSGDNGPATGAELFQPLGVALDSAGNLYIADSDNMRIRKVSSTGVITTVAGNGTPGFSGDGGPATSTGLNYPSGVALDSAGSLYIADAGNNRIRKVSNGVITTVAGNGAQGFGGDGGPATGAQLFVPAGVAVDSAGSLYIADAGNNRIRKVSNGVITTVAGNGAQGFGGDGGPATSAQLFVPAGVAVDSAGSLYIADAGNNRIRKVSKGVITTVAGNGTLGFGGDGGPATNAQLYGPEGVAVDSAGNIYIADMDNNRIRKVSNGVITTAAGNGTQGFSGDNGPATSAELYRPEGIAVDATGNLYIADTWNNRIGILTPTGSCTYSVAPTTLHWRQFDLQRPNHRCLSLDNLRPAGLDHGLGRILRCRLRLRYSRGFPQLWNSTERVDSDRRRIRHRHSASRGCGAVPHHQGRDERGELRYRGSFPGRVGYPVWHGHRTGHCGGCDDGSVDRQASDNHRRRAGAVQWCRRSHDLRQQHTGVGGGAV